MSDSLYPNNITTLEQIPGPAIPFGTTLVTFIAADTAGNQESCNSSIVVQDLEPPSVHCPVRTSLPENPNSLTSSVPIFVQAADNVGLSSLLVTVDVYNTSSSTSTVLAMEWPTPTLPASLLKDSELNITDVTGSGVAYALTSTIAGYVLAVSARPEIAATSGQTVTVNVSAIDLSGNINQCSFTITVVQSAVTTALLDVLSGGSRVSDVRTWGLADCA